MTPTGHTTPCNHQAAQRTARSPPGTAAAPCHRPLGSRSGTRRCCRGTCRSGMAYHTQHSAAFLCLQCRLHCCESVPKNPPQKIRLQIYFVGALLEIPRLLKSQGGLIWGLTFAFVLLLKISTEIIFPFQGRVQKQVQRGGLFGNIKKLSQKCQF